MKRILSVLAVSALAVMPLAACGSETTTPASGSQSAAKDQALADRLPQKLKDSGTITLGTNPEYAPIDMLGADGNTPEGVDIDLMNAVGQKLGLTVKWQSGSFDSLIGGVQGGKYDAAASAFTIREDRMKTVNMVSYFSAGVRWAVKSGNPNKFDSTNPCGKKVAVAKGTYEEQDLLPEMNKEQCASSPIDIQIFNSQPEAGNAVATGRVDATVADSPVTDYYVKQSNGQLETNGEMTDAAPYGIVVPKDQTELAQVIADALSALKKDGTYDAILKKWGVESGGVSEFTVNPKL